MARTNVHIQRTRKTSKKTFLHFPKTLADKHFLMPPKNGLLDFILNSIYLGANWMHRYIGYNLILHPVQNIIRTDMKHVLYGASTKTLNQSYVDTMLTRPCLKTPKLVMKLLPAIFGSTYYVSELYCIIYFTSSKG